jgi:signal recognition particle subunit SEC65
MGKRKGGHVVKVKMDGGAAPNAAAMMNPMNMLMGAAGEKDEEQQELMQQLQTAAIAPDRNYQLFWPMHQTFSMKTTGFQVIYPQYLDGSKTVAQGRRIPQSRAVQPSPSVADLSGALQRLGLRHVVQPYKGYSRDITTTWDNPGRVLVDIRQSSHANKRELLLKMCEIIPTLPDRVVRQERQSAQREVDGAKLELARQKYLQQQQPTSHATTKGTTATTKKKGSTKKSGKKK